MSIHGLIKENTLNHSPIPSPVLIKDFFLLFFLFLLRSDFITDGRNKELTLHILYISLLSDSVLCDWCLFFTSSIFMFHVASNSPLLLRFYWFPYGFCLREQEKNWVLDDDETSFMWALNSIWFFNSRMRRISSVFNLLIDFQFNKKP